MALPKLPRIACRRTGCRTCSLADGAAVVRLAVASETERNHQAEAFLSSVTLLLYWEPRTIDKKIASYWVVRSAKLDGSANRGLILIFDSAAIEAADYTLTPYSDPVWGVGVCDWEKEVTYWSDLPNFNHLLIDFEVNKGGEMGG